MVHTFKHESNGHNFMTSNLKNIRKYTKLAIFEFIILFIASSIIPLYSSAQPPEWKEALAALEANSKGGIATIPYPDLKASARREQDKVLDCTKDHESFKCGFFTIKSSREHISNVEGKIQGTKNDRLFD